MIKLLPKAFCPEPAEAKRDEELSLKVAALQHFLQPRHLDIPPHLQNDASWLVRLGCARWCTRVAPVPRLQGTGLSCAVLYLLLCIHSHFVLW